MFNQIRKGHYKLILVLSFFLAFLLGGLLLAKFVFAAPAQVKQDTQQTPSQLTAVPDSEKILLAENGSGDDSEAEGEGSELPNEEDTEDNSEAPSQGEGSDSDPATNEEVPGEYKLDSPITVGGGDIGSIIGAIIDILFGAAAVVALIYIIIGGYNYITSSGNPEALEAAKGTVMNAIIGLLIVLISYLAIDLLLDSLEVSIELSI